MEDATLSLQVVTKDQRPRFKAMLQEFDLPTEGVEDEGHWFFLCGPNEEILGTAGLEVYHSVGLLRSVCIPKAHQGQGLGQFIVSRLEQEALRQGLKDLFLLTTAARDFFLRQGFSEITRSEVPQVIKQTQEFQSLCPDSAAVMHKGISAWTEDDSEFFLQNANILVPERTYQKEVILDLLAQQKKLQHITELCCGAGELSAAILRFFPQCQVLALDASEKMLAQTSKRLKPFGKRAQVKHFRLEAKNWRQGLQTDAFVSSLAVHHLDGSQKQPLFRDLHRLLPPGGLFILADLVQTTRPIGTQIAARAWDAWVRENSTQRPELFDRFKTDGWNYYDDPGADPIDQPDRLTDLLDWMREAGFIDIDLAWMKAGHVILFGWKGKSH
jgi:tRNA (cmo5U34)-methyltransferase